MYKHNNEYTDYKHCCPLGTDRGNGVIECYYYNLVSKDFCENCMLNSGKNLIMVKK